MNEDIIITNSDWVNLNTLSSISIGTGMVIVNKGSSVVMVASSSAKPTTNNIGLPLTQYSVIQMASGSSDPVWVKGSPVDLRLSVQTV
jgi:hypothetical protein